MTRHSVGLVNVPVKVGPRAWSKCFRILAGSTSVFGINESLSPKQRAVYAAEAQVRGWGFAGLHNSPNPIFFQKGRWKKVRGTTRVVKIHGPGPWARQWPGYNAARYFTLVYLDHRETGQRHAFIASHLVPNGAKVEPRWREHVRAVSFAKLRDLTDACIDEQLPTWLVGDMNYPDVIPMGRDFRWLRPRGIDKIGLGLPAGYSLDGLEIRQVAVPSDHPFGVVATVTLSTTTSR